MIALQTEQSIKPDGIGSGSFYRTEAPLSSPATELATSHPRQKPRASAIPIEENKVLAEQQDGCILWNRLRIWRFFAGQSNKKEIKI